MGGRKYNVRKLSTTETNYQICPPFLQKKMRFYYFKTAPPAITKSWLPPPTRCGSAAYQRPQLDHVVTNSSPKPNPDSNPHNHFIGDSSIAEAVHEMPNASLWCLLKLDLNAKIHPPPIIPSDRPDLLAPPPTLTCVLSPNTPSSGLMVNYLVCRPTSRVYRRTTVLIRHECTTVSIRHECTMADPFHAKAKLMEFTSVVKSEGKFYAITLQGALVVMQANDMRLKITAVGVNRAVPEMSCRHFKEYLVEMKGEILLVYLIHGKSLANVDGVEVYRLDFVKLDRIKVARLPGNTLFLNENCVCVDSGDFGCRDDCVYFYLRSENFWRMYDMKSGSISLAPEYAIVRRLNYK